MQDTQRHFFQKFFLWAIAPVYTREIHPGRKPLCGTRQGRCSSLSERWALLQTRLHGVSFLPSSVTGTESRSLERCDRTPLALLLEQAISLFMASSPALVWSPTAARHLGKKGAIVLGRMHTLLACLTSPNTGCFLCLCMGQRHPQQMSKCFVS